jgi:hypothetical protein
MAASEYVSQTRIAEFGSLKTGSFDTARLVRLCEELNIAHQNRCYLSIAMIARTIINHVPPVFGFKTFSEVTNNWSGGRSFKELMERLDSSLRKVADTHLHKPISKSESLPQFTQVNFMAEMDVLLAEVFTRLK